MNGDDSVENLVNLTPEEHYLAHQLLVKIHPDHYGLVKAAVMMSLNLDGNRPKNKLYGWLRRRHSLATTGQNNINFGKPRTDEVKSKISLSNTGKGGSKLRGRKKGPMREETKEKLRKSLSGRLAPHQAGDKNVSKRPEVAKKISIANSGRTKGPLSAETKRAISLANKGRAGLSGSDNPGSWKISCIFCRKEVTVPSLTRWHNSCILTQTKEYHDI
jgi:hypothetical protein